MHGGLLMQSFSLLFQPQRIRRFLDAIVGKFQVQAVLLQFIFGQKFRQIGDLRAFVTIATTRYHF